MLEDLLASPLHTDFVADFEDGIQLEIQAIDNPISSITSFFEREQSIGRKKALEMARYWFEGRLIEIKQQLDEHTR
jgi:hypothetical protein